jgi:hypothetical protein
MFKIIGAVVVYGFAIFGLVKALEAHATTRGSSSDKEGTSD